MATDKMDKTTKHNKKLFSKICFVCMLLINNVSFTDSHVPACGTGFFECDEGQCIYAQWTCDGDEDCVDGTDENLSFCGNATCRPDHFSCGDGRPCIPESWKCDGHDDCPNGSDEESCGSSKCKELEEFQCKSQRRCITVRWRCDQEPDCEDSSDEADCALQTCSPTQFECGTGVCVPLPWRCDGDNDCMDGTDELNCTAPIVKQCRTDFQCRASSECIHKAWTCDGDPDCSDGSDEYVTLCGLMSCRPDQFQCIKDGLCIPERLRCDRVDHCKDKSDERDCPNTVCDAKMSFDCTGNKENCIDISRVCDGNNDCGSWEDENTTICRSTVNMCKVQNGGCLHECVSNPVTQYCKCREGYELDINGKTCSDVNECEVSGTCSQQCINTPGSFKCKCKPGYEMDHKDHSCRAAGREPVLLFTNRHDLRKIHLHTGLYQALVEKLHSAIGLDYDYREGLLYWSDVASEKISRGRLFVNGTRLSEHIVVGNISTPDGLALDWIHKNLYWTDTGKNRIEVLSVTGTLSRKVLFNSSLDEPRAITVDPRTNQRYIYWTDWGDNPRIERAVLDGSDRVTLISTDIQWPNGLTIDYESDLLFWVDAKLHIIGSCDLNGQHRRIMITSYQYLKHPFSITVFEDDIYWSDWEAQSILKVNKFHAEQRKNAVTNVAMNLYSPMGVHIYHELKQPIGDNACLNSGCSHICLPRRGAGEFVCACPEFEIDRYKLDDDMKTCYSTAAGRRRLTTEASKSLVTSSYVTAEAEKRSHAILSVIIALGVILLIVLIAAAVVYVLRCRRRSIKNMNFDNPVYRRTTEENVSFHHSDRSQFQPPKLSSLLEPLTSSEQI